jgi:hypothetical protein
MQPMQQAQLADSTSAKDANDDDTEHHLAPGEEYASPYEQHMLDKTMGAVYSALNKPNQLRTLESYMVKSPNLGPTLGQIAFRLLVTIYTSAKKAGVQIPMSVFIAQGGAIYQTIERLLLIAEHCGAQVGDPGKVREDALGTVLDQYHQHPEIFKGQPQAQGGEAPAGSPGAMAANPLSAAVGQGIQDQQQQAPQQQGILAGA